MLGICNPSGALLPAYGDVTYLILPVNMFCRAYRGIGGHQLKKPYTVLIEGGRYGGRGGGHLRPLEALGRFRVTPGRGG